MLTIVAVLLRIVSNPFGNVFQKRLTADGLPPLLVNFLTYFLLAACSTVLLSGIDLFALPPPFWTYSLLGGAVGAMGNAFLVKALTKGELSVLGPINAYKAVVGIFAGILFLGEMPTIWALAGLALIIWGSYFVLDTTAEKFSWTVFRKREIQFRLWAMILAAIEAVFVKKVILASTVSLAFWSWCNFGAFFSLMLLLFSGTRLLPELRSLQPLHLRWLLALLVCIGTMQFTTNYAFAHMPVGYALALFQLSTVVSVLLGHQLFGEAHLRKKLMGTLIMICGSLLILLVH